LLVALAQLPRERGFDELRQGYTAPNGGDLGALYQRVRDSSEKRHLIARLCERDHGREIVDF